MDKMLKSCNPGVAIFFSVFMLSVVGFSAFYVESVSARWRDQVAPVYKVYVKTGTATVISNKSTSPYSPNWVLDGFTPRVTTNGRGCDSGNSVIVRDFDDRRNFNDCEALSIQEHNGTAANGAWFQEANMSFEIGDFDNAETIGIGRGYIVASGASAVGTPRGQTARAEKNDNGHGCDSPNPDYSETCSLLIYFTRGNPGDFHISLDNTWNSNGTPSSGHEYWYDGPVTEQYRTLTLNPNGGSVAENGADANTLVSHMSGASLLREYDSDNTSINYPVPTRSGNTFRGWYTAPSGGSLRTSWSMGSDMTLYAHWTSWSMAGTTTIKDTNTGQAIANNGFVAPDQKVTFTHYVRNAGSDATGQDIWSDTQVSGGVGTAKGGHNGGQYAGGQQKETDTDTITIPPNATNGAQYCQRVGFQWSANNNSAYGSGPWACVTVKVPNKLSCGATTFSGPITANMSYAFTAVVNGTIDPPSQITAIVTGPNGFSYTNTVSGASLGVSGTRGTASFSFTPANPGNYALTWSARDSSGISVSGCATPAIIAGDQPYFQVQGDILGGFGGFDAATSIIASWNSNNSADNYRGAGTTLAAIAGTQINSFVTSSANNSPSRLAFANTPASVSPPKYGGGFTALPSEPDYYSNASGTTQNCSSSTLSVASLVSGLYSCTGNITLNGGQLVAGTNVTIRTTGNIFIAGNITYAPYSLTNIPRLNVITKGGNIIVSSTVTEMHGVFVAQKGTANTGLFYSCGGSLSIPYGYTTNDAQCITNTLTVYGSVIADKLILGRTQGSWHDLSSQPAETFIHSPETWLSKPASSGTTTKTKFDSYISLPPVL